MDAPGAPKAVAPRRGGAWPPCFLRVPVDASQPTVLVLTAPTGAGHDSTAAALADALRATLPRARVLVRNPLGARAAGVSRVGWWYDLVVARAPRLWGWLYYLSNNRCGVRLGAAIVAALYGRRLRATVRATRPALIVSVHPLCVRLAAHSLRRVRRPAPHHCMVTDLASIHRYWASGDVSAFYAATPRAAAALESHGIPAGRIRVTGLPLRRAFAAPPLGVADDGDPTPRVVVLDGGRATRTLERAVRALLASGAPLCLTVVCGGNDRLRRRLAAATTGRATVLGWCGDVAGVMRASSVVVTKAGSATLAEAWSQARPTLVYRVLPGQEEGNVALLDRDGWGEYVSCAGALPSAVRRVHGRGPGMREATWWGQAADRVAAHVVDALGTPARVTLDGHGPRPTPAAPHATRGYPAPATAKMGHADRARSQPYRGGAYRGGGRRPPLDTTRIEEDCSP